MKSSLGFRGSSPTPFFRLTGALSAKPSGLTGLSTLIGSNLLARARCETELRGWSLYRLHLQCTRPILHTYTTLWHILDSMRRRCETQCAAAMRLDAPPLESCRFVVE